MTTQISTEEMKAMASAMSGPTRQKVWNYLELLAKNAALESEVERLKFEKREAEQNYASISRLAESQALELVQVRQGMAQRVRWKCRINPNTSEGDYERLLNDGWDIVRSQFEGGALRVIAKKQQPIDQQPAPTALTTTSKTELNARIMTVMQDAFAAAGGGASFVSIEEMRGHGRTKRAGDFETIDGHTVAADAE